MRHIQDNDPLYNFLRGYMEKNFRLIYRRLEYVGRENIPTDGALIFASNHTNGLQDPIALASTDHKAKVFAARADMFRSPFVAKVMKRLKVTPINRIRDGRENLRKDDAQMDLAAEILSAGTAFALFPEATQRCQHSLLPLAKGICRIAYRAYEQLRGVKPVYIVPVGLEYGSYFRYRSTLLVNIGTPIDVTAFFDQHQDLTQPQQFLLLAEMLAEKLKSLILYLPANESYEALLEGVYGLAESGQASQKNSDSTLLARLKCDQVVAAQLQEAAQTDPERMAPLLSLLQKEAQLRKQKHILVHTLQHFPSVGSVSGRALLLLLTLPFFLWSALAIGPILLLEAPIFARLEDRAFLNSYRCVFSAVLLPLWYLVCVVLMMTLVSVGWGVLLLVLLLPAHSVFYEYVRQAERLASAIRALACPEWQRLSKALKRFHLQK